MFTVKHLTLSIGKILNTLYTNFNITFLIETVNNVKENYGEHNLSSNAQLKNIIISLKAGKMRVILYVIILFNCQRSYADIYSFGHPNLGPPIINYDTIFLY